MNETVEKCYCDHLLHEENMDNRKLKNGPRFGKRHEQLVLYFSVIIMAYSMRTNISMSLVAMTDRNASKNADIPTFNWTNQNIIISSFFWGYLIPQIGAGWLASRYDPKWCLIGAIGSCSLLGMLIPITATTFGSESVIFIRILQGISQGFIYPSMPSLLSSWIPFNERNTAGAIVYSGNSVGNLIGAFLSAFIGASWYGWPMIFYVFGVMGITWCIVFGWFGYSTPALHPRITLAERNFIHANISYAAKKEKPPTPWKDILSSPPFLILMFVQFGFSWGFWTLVTQTPLYIQRVLKFDIKSNGILSSAPYLVEYVISILVCFASDRLIARKKCSVGASRKFCVAFGSIITAIALIILANCGPHNISLAVFSLFLAMCVNNVGVVGFLINHMDLTPNYASVLMGICNCFGNFSSILAPLFVQFVVTDQGDYHQWQYVFYFSTGLFFAVAIGFCVFGSGEIQPWDDKGVKPEEMEKMRS